MYIGEIIEERPLDMELFNSSASGETATQVLATIEEPRRRQIMQNYIDHAHYEGIGDLDRLMQQCSKERQQYLKIGDTDPSAGLPQNYRELEKYYYKLVCSNTYILHREIDKLIVGDNSLLTDGVIHTLYPGAYLQDEMNVPDIDRVTVYQLTKRVPVVFLFNKEGLSVGEHIYMTTSTAQLTVVDIERVPEQFWDNPITGKYSL